MVVSILETRHSLHRKENIGHAIAYLDIAIAYLDGRLTKDDRWILADRDPDDAPPS